MMFGHYYHHCELKIVLGFQLMLDISSKAEQLGIRCISEVPSYFRKKSARRALHWGPYLWFKLAKYLTSK